MTQPAGNAIPKLGDSEAYTLEISTDKGTYWCIRRSVGAMRGFETLLQLLESDKDGFYFPAVSITDQPRFAWRGLMIDSGPAFSARSRC